MQNYLTMNLVWSILCFLVFVFIVSPIQSHPLSKPREHERDGHLKLEPIEDIVSAGTDVTFTCSHPENVTFLWELNTKILSNNYTVVNGASLSNRGPYYYSKITIHRTNRLMSGEIACTLYGRNSRTIGFLIVKGVQIGSSCRNTSDCITDRAVCQDGLCQCPMSHVHLQLTENGYDVCREMIYSLYDPCDLNEQCSLLVDPLAICNSVCVCAPYAKDRKGRCISLRDISNSRSQEMYRVGLIAVTCIIILIVAMSLWVTLKRSCNERRTSGLNGTTQTDVSYPEGLAEIVPDKPPSYDDVIVRDDVVSAPPNIKDALKHCMTAKRLLRQVSAPAGQLLPQQGINTKPAGNDKALPGP